MNDNDEDDVVGRAVRSKRRFPTATSTYIPKAAQARPAKPAKPAAVRLLGRLARKDSAA